MLLIDGARPAQLFGLGTASTVFFSVFFYERHRGATRRATSTGFVRSLVFTVFGIAVACTATGGIHSPLTAMLFAPLGVGFAAFGASRRSSVLLVLLAFVLAWLTFVGPHVSSLAMTAAPHRAVLVAAILDAAILLRVGVVDLSAARARDESTLAAAGDEHVRELSRPSARASRTTSRIRSPPFAPWSRS